MVTHLKRHPNVPQRAFALTPKLAEVQVSRGLFTVQAGEKLAIPSDRLSEPGHLLSRDLWRNSPEHGVHRPGADFRTPNLNPWQRRALEWLRDHVWEEFPQAVYKLVLGHDLHVSVFGNLYGKHFHSGWANPFNPEQLDEPLDPWALTHPSQAAVAKLHRKIAMLQGHEAAQAWIETQPKVAIPAGFIENLGWLSGGKVTTAFVSKEVAELVAAAEYADFDFHEVGTSAAAEANTETALVATSGIARATGTPTDADPIYQNVGTVTADATETWEEHGLFNNSTGPTLMDRSLTGGQSVSSGNSVQYTYQLTKNAEA